MLCLSAGGNLGVQLSSLTFIGTESFTIANAIQINQLDIGNVYTVNLFCLWIIEHICLQY